MRTHPNFFLYYFVGNKAKGWISKWVFQENKTRQIFRETNISYPMIRTHNLFSWNILALLPCYRRFNVLLPSIHSAWHYRISLLFEFLTAERDWKFLLIRMFSNRKYSLDIVGIYSQKHIQNPACEISLRWSFSWK